MKLERSDSMHRPVTPVTRRISLSVMSPRPPQIVERGERVEHMEPETDKFNDKFNDNCDFDRENQLTRFDSEVESVNEVETIQPGDGFPHEPVIGDLIGTPSLPGACQSEHVCRDGIAH